MARVDDSLLRRYFKPEDHPYAILERRVAAEIRPETVVLDAGCGRGAVRLAKLAKPARQGIGVDLVEFTPAAKANPRLELHRADLGRMPVGDETVDLGYSVSVFEHIERPLEVYRELRRVLKPGARMHVLTPNRWDYGSVASALTPNRLHPWIVEKTEGRAAEDTFPTYYRSNTRRAIRALAEASGLEAGEIGYIGQYPNYLMFSRALFLAGTAYQKTIERFGATAWLQGWIYAVLRKP